PGPGGERVVVRDGGGVHDVVERRFGGVVADAELDVRDQRQRLGDERRGRGPPRPPGRAAAPRQRRAAPGAAPPAARRPPPRGGGGVAGGVQGGRAVEARADGGEAHPCRAVRRRRRGRGQRGAVGAGGEAAEALDGRDRVLDDGGAARCEEVGQRRQLAAPAV